MSDFMYACCRGALRGAAAARSASPTAFRVAVAAGMSESVNCDAIKKDTPTGDETVLE